MSDTPGETFDLESVDTESTVRSIPSRVPPPRDPWWQPVQRTARNWNAVRQTEQTHVVAMLPSFLQEYLRSLGENWYAAFTYRHKPPSNPSQGSPQPQRFDAQIRLRCRPSCFQVWTHNEVCFVDHNNVSSGWHGQWELISTQGNRSQLRLKFRYNAEEPYWHVAEYSEGFTAAVNNRRFHIAFWYGTKFEGWAREEQDRHEFWILEPPIFYFDPPRAIFHFAIAA